MLCDYLGLLGQCEMNQCAWYMLDQSRLNCKQKVELVQTTYYCTLFRSGLSYIGRAHLQHSSAYVLRAIFKTQVIDNLGQHMILAGYAYELKLRFSPTIHEQVITDLNK